MKDYGTHMTILYIYHKAVIHGVSNTLLKNANVEGIMLAIKLNG